jgi:hypothetical protein
VLHRVLHISIANGSFRHAPYTVENRNYFHRCERRLGRCGGFSCVLVVEIYSITSPLWAHFIKFMGGQVIRVAQDMSDQRRPVTGARSPENRTQDSSVADYSTQKRHAVGCSGGGGLVQSCVMQSANLPASLSAPL